MPYQINSSTIIDDSYRVLTAEGLQYGVTTTTISGNYTFNLNSQSVVRATVTGSSHAFTFTNLPANGQFRVWQLYIIQGNTTARTYTFQSGNVKWSYGIEPVLSPSVTNNGDLLTFCCYDGSTVIGNHVMTEF